MVIDINQEKEEGALTFICCAVGEARLRSHLLASPCLGKGTPHQLLIFHDAASVAEALRTGLAQAANPWVVLVHDDVFLPAGWDTKCWQQLAEATRRYGRPPALAGVFGVQSGRRCGHVQDRGTLLKMGEGFPCMADALDELLLVLPADSDLEHVDALGFHLFGTDLVLQAQQRGSYAAVLDAYCEHGSGLPTDMAEVTSEKIAEVDRSVRVFQSRWTKALPVRTPCFDISADGWAPY